MPNLIIFISAVILSAIFDKKWFLSLSFKPDTQKLKPDISAKDEFLVHNREISLCADNFRTSHKIQLNDC